MAGEGPLEISTNLVRGHFYIRCFEAFLKHPPTKVRTFSLNKIRKNCHFLDNPPTPTFLHNIKMAHNSGKGLWTRDKSFSKYSICFGLLSRLDCVVCNYNFKSFRICSKKLFCHWFCINQPFLIQNSNH